VLFYARYPVSFRELQEILDERDISVGHATLNRWVVRYSLQIAEQAQILERRTASSWRVYETHTKVKGKWTYLYRTVYRYGQTHDFILSERRDLASARG
jgi:putative transposase